MRYIYSIVCCMVLLFSATVLAQGIVEPGNEPPVVVAIGDSLFTGYGVSDNSNVPQMIKYQLIARNYQLNMKNLSTRTQTLEKALKKAESVIERHKPKAAIICLGLQDVKNNATLVSIYENLSKLVKTYRDANVHVLLVGFELPSDVPDVYKRASHRKKFQEIYKKVAQQYQIPFYPNLFKSLDDLLFYRTLDKYHLNKKGVKYVSEKLYSTVGMMIR